MDDWDKIEAEILEDADTRAAVQALQPRYDLARTMIAIRASAALTQRELAARAGMTQPEIARLESGQVAPTWDTLARIFRAVDAEVAIRLRGADGRVTVLKLGLPTAS